jgi:hypothetical protein
LVVIEEADETAFWLELLVEAAVVNARFGEESMERSRRAHAHFRHLARDSTAET